MQSNVNENHVLLSYSRDLLLEFIKEIRYPFNIILLHVCMPHYLNSSIYAWVDLLDCQIEASKEPQEEPKEQEAQQEEQPQEAEGGKASPQAEKTAEEGMSYVAMAGWFFAHANVFIYACCYNALQIS